MRLEERLERKRRGMAMLRAGTAGKDVAEALGVDAATVSRWRKDLTADALTRDAPTEALEAPPEPPAPPEANPQAHSTATPKEARGRRAKERRATAAFYLPVALLVRLDAMAGAEGVSVSAIVERLLRQALGQ